eukprot:15157011-Heterocapsa_arctica.AAC.1
MSVSVSSSAAFFSSILFSFWSSSNASYLWSATAVSSFCSLSISLPFSLNIENICGLGRLKHHDDLAVLLLDVLDLLHLRHAAWEPENGFMTKCWLMIESVDR